MKALLRVRFDCQVNGIYSAENKIINYAHLNKFADKIFNKIKTQSSIANRTYFANAVTPKGNLSYLAEYTPETRILRIDCKSDAVCKKIIETIKSKLTQYYCRFDSLNCPFTPFLTQNLIVGDYLVTNDRNLEAEEVFEFPLSVPNLDSDKAVFNQLVNKSVYFLQQARVQHMAVERYYVEAMDFADINRKTERIINMIF